MNHYELPDGERLERVRRETVEALAVDDLVAITSLAVAAAEGGGRCSQTQADSQENE